MNFRFTLRALLLAVSLSLIGIGACSRSSAPAGGQGQSAKPAPLTVNWDKVEGISKTTATLQVVVNPPLRRGSPIHDHVFEALHNLGADYVRYVPWLPYPRLGVAELEPPSNGKTSWDFSLIDPMMEDFMSATAGHSVVINFSTIPQWMWKTDKPVIYPADPNQAVWNYEQGTELVDPSMKQVADYYARLVSWYTKGGFTDEYGHAHRSGHRYKIDYWEVLNEVDFEHHMTPAFYTRLYDAITGAIHHVDSRIKFAGLALAAPSQGPQYFEYFLNPKNHKPGAPLDMISYHFYAHPSSDEPPDAWQYTFFNQADGFLDTVRYVQAIRERLSPQTKTDLDELGAILPGDPAGKEHIPDFYWNLCSAMYAYLYGHLAQLGVEVAGESQLVGYPTQFPSVSMVDWKTGQPNARFWTLKLLHDHFGPGDKLIETRAGAPGIYSQGFVKPNGAREVLLVNERNRSVDVSIAGASGGEEEYVDQTTGEQPAAKTDLVGGKITLGRFSVAVVTLSK